jgi:hypothetical protein
MEEKATQKKAEAKVETLVWEISDLRITTDKFVAQVPALEEKVLNIYYLPRFESQNLILSLRR